MGQDLSSIALGKRDLETTQVAVVGSGVYSHEGAVPCSEKGLQFPPRTWGCRVDTVSDSKPLEAAGLQSWSAQRPQTNCAIRNAEEGR